MYFLLIEAEMRALPSHGFIVLGDGIRHRVDNTDELRAWVLNMAAQIRTARRAVTVPIPVNPKPGHCRPCGMRGNWGQARNLKCSNLCLANFWRVDGTIRT